MSFVGGVLAMWFLMSAVAALAWVVCRAFERRAPATIEHEYPRAGERGREGDR